MTYRVLIADDSETIQKVVKISLSNQGYQFFAASSEDELIKICSEQVFDLILLDFGLSSEKNGYEVAKDILKNNKGKHIIMMFGAFDSIDKVRLKSSGVFHHLIRPFEGGKLIEISQLILGGSSNLKKDEVEVEKIEEEDNDIGEDFSNWQLEQSSFAEEKNSIDEKQSGKDEAQEKPANLDQEDGDVVECKSDKSLTQEFHETEKIFNVELDEWRHDIPPVMNYGKGEKNKSEGLIEEKLPPIPSKILSRNQSLKNKNKERSEEVKVEIEEIPTEIEYKAEDSDLFEGEIIRDKESLTDDNLWEVDEEISERVRNVLAKNDGIDLKKDDNEGDEKIEISSDLEKETEKLLFQKVGESIESDELYKKIEGKIDISINENIREVIENCVQRHVKEVLNEVAWNIIPELAENIIKAELGKISDSVINKN